MGCLVLARFSRFSCMALDAICSPVFLHYGVYFLFPFSFSLFPFSYFSFISYYSFFFFLFLFYFHLRGPV